MSVPQCAPVRLIDASACDQSLRAPALEALSWTNRLPNLGSAKLRCLKWPAAKSKEGAEDHKPQQLYIQLEFGLDMVLVTSSAFVVQATEPTRCSPDPQQEEE